MPRAEQPGDNQASAVKGITSRDLTLSLTPQGTLGPSRFGDIPGELNTGGDSSNPADYAVSLPLRGIGMAGQALGTGIKATSDFIGQTPIGQVGSIGGNAVGSAVDGFGKGFLDLLGAPSGMIQDIGAHMRLALTKPGDLPTDVQQMMSSGVSVDQIVKHMRENGQSFSNDKTINLGLSILLDPLNLTPFALGKVNLLKSLGKFGAIGAGLAAGSTAGPLGALVGAGAGYVGRNLVAGTRFGSMVGELASKVPVVGGTRGLEIGSKIKAYRTFQESAQEIPEALKTVSVGWGDGLHVKVPTALFSAVDSATFGYLRNIGGAVKKGLGITVTRALVRAYNESSINDAYRAAERIGGETGAATMFKRFAIANVNRAISGLTRFKTDSISDWAASTVDTLDSDVKVAIMDYRNAGMSGGSTDFVIGRLKNYAEQAGRTLEEKYGLTESDINGYLQDTHTTYMGRNIDPKTGYEIIDDTDTIKLAKARLEERITEAKSRVDLQGFDAVKYATEAADQLGDRLNKYITNEVQSSARKHSEVIGAGGDIVSQSVLAQATRLAENIAGSATDNVSRSAGSAAADAGHIGIILDEFFGGARLSDGKVVGGKFFDEAGNITTNLRETQQQLVQRLNLAESITYGYNINRLGNVRRIMGISVAYGNADATAKASYLAEASKLMGKQITDAQMKSFASIAEKGMSFAKPTFVRNDSLLASKVPQWTDLYDAISGGDQINFAAYGEIPQQTLAKISEAIQNGAKKEEVLKIWAYKAAQEFVDVGNHFPGMKIARGMVSPSEVNGMLRSASSNGALVARASASELQSLKQAWMTLGGDVSEIEAIVNNAKRDGYEIGMAPESGTVKEVRQVTTLKNAEGMAVPETIARTRPFIDITSDFVDGLPDFADKTKYQAGTTRKAIEFLSAPVYQSGLASQSIQRLQLGLRDRFSADEITAFYNRVLKDSAAGRVGVRGLTEQAYSDIMDNVLKEGGGSLAERQRMLNKAGMGPIDLQAEVIKAMRGSADQVGYSQAITGTLKDQGVLGIGKMIATISENFYPTLKYKLNPMFFAQELIESPFFAQMRGIEKSAMELKLREAGISAQELRASFGDRGNAMRESIQEQAFFTFTARSREGLPSTMRQSTTVRDVLSGGRMGAWDRMADFKESYADVMAIHEMAPAFQEWVMKTKPDEFAALYKTYGPDAMDQMLGWYSQYRRNSSLLFGGSMVDRLKAPGFGFAVNPSRDGLLEAQRNFDSIINSTNIEDFSRHVNNGLRPTAVGSVIRAKVINVAQDSGYDVGRLRQAVSNYDAMAVAYAREFQRGGANLEIIAAEYKKAQEVVKSEVNSLGKQLIVADVNKAIVEELMNSAVPGFSETENAAKVIEALSNARKYGAELRPLADLVDEIRMNRFAGGLTSLKPGTREQIRAVVNNITAGESSLAQSARNVRSILTDATQSLLRDHAGEETLFQAAKFSYMKSAEAMNKVNYFRPDRSLFERGINHQFLGLYPFSYMVGKVLPEIARFLFWKPFGAIAPGAGYNAYRKVSDYIKTMGPPPEWRQTTQRPDYEFLLAQLLPGTPDDITVVVPGWMRRAVSTVSRQGYDQYGVVEAGKELLTPFTNTGLGGTIQLLAKSAGEVSNLAATAGTDFFSNIEPSFRK